MDTTNNTNQKKSIRGLKIALTRKANKLNAKITNLIIRDDDMVILILSLDSPISAEIELKNLVVKFGYKLV